MITITLFVVLACCFNERPGATIIGLIAWGYYASH